MNSKFALYEKLELLPVGSLQAVNQSRLRRTLRFLANQCLRALTTTGEPRIWSRSYDESQPLPDGYAPITHERLRGASEEQLRYWLTQRNYRLITML